MTNLKITKNVPATRLIKKYPLIERLFKCMTNCNKDIEYLINWIVA